MPNNDAYISGGAQILGSTIDAFATGNMNKKNRRWAENMYERQQADRLAAWNLQNEYDSPAAQMQRFKDAGLNPALIYGQQNTSSPLTTSDIQKPDTETPKYGAGIAAGALTTIDQIYNLEMKQAQTDNVKLQADILRQDAILRQKQITDVDASGRRKLFDLDLESELRPTSVDARKEQLRQMYVNTDVAMSRDIREQLQNSSNLREANERILNLIEQRQSMKLQQANTAVERSRILEDTKRIRKQTELLAKEGIIKKLDAELASKNIRPGDPVWYRSLGQAYDLMLDFFNNK